MADKLIKMIRPAIVSCIIVFSAAPATAGVVEFFKCKLADTATMEQLVSTATAMLTDAKAHGLGDYSLYFLNPLYSSDISNGTFYWVGASPNATRLGAYNDFWIADAMKKHRDKFRPLIKECSASGDSAGVLWITEVKAAE
jgi:hypothetical protein